ncbi:MAG: hypothetical protein RLZZ630_727, partial [Bacteroidota bacterium]
MGIAFQMKYTLIEDGGKWLYVDEVHKRQKLLNCSTLGDIQLH